MDGFGNSRFRVWVSGFRAFEVAQFLATLPVELGCCCWLKGRRLQGFWACGFNGLWSVRFRVTHRLQSSSALGLPYRILNISHKKGLLWSLWVRLKKFAWLSRFRREQLVDLIMEQHKKLEKYHKARRKAGASQAFGGPWSRVRRALQS